VTHFLINHEGTDPNDLPEKWSLIDSVLNVIFLSSILEGFKPLVSRRRVMTTRLSVVDPLHKGFKNNKCVGKPSLSRLINLLLEYNGFPHRYLVI